jgi:hypothetical protein
MMKVHFESITALPEDGGWEGNKKLNYRAVLDWLSGHQHAWVLKFSSELFGLQHRMRRG